MFIIFLSFLQYENKSKSLFNFQIKTVLIIKLSKKNSTYSIRIVDNYSVDKTETGIDNIPKYIDY